MKLTSARTYLKTEDIKQGDQITILDGGEFVAVRPDAFNRQVGENGTHRVIGRLDFHPDGIPTRGQRDDLRDRLSAHGQRRGQAQQQANRGDPIRQRHDPHWF